MTHRHAWTLLLLLLAPLAQAAELSQHPGENFDPPTPNHPWQHLETGLRFPQKLGQMDSAGRFVYEEKDLGTMLRYASEKQRIRADIFIYPCKAPHATTKEVMDAASEEAGNVLGEITAAVKQGAYSNMEQGEATYQEIELFPEDPGNSCLLEMPLTLTIHEKDVAGESDTQVRSLVTLSIYRGHFIKSRCTYPAEPDKKTEAMVDEFVKQLRMCVLEPGLRKGAEKHIREYRADPLSARAREVVGAILVYAENTPMFNFSVSSALASLAQPLKKDFPDAELDLFRAFIVGAVAAAIQEPVPEKLSLEQAGAAEVVKLHALMAKQHPGLQNALMDDLIQAVNKGEAAGWFTAQDKQAQ